MFMIKDRFISSFPMWMHAFPSSSLFFFFALLHCLDPLVQSWIDVVRVDIFITYDINCRALTDILYQVKEVSSMFSLLGVFVRNELNFVKCFFFASTEIMLLCFWSLIYWALLIDFHSRDELHLVSWYIIIFISCWLLLADILFRVFAFISLGNTGL